jgi:tetratricopeptide (TPR) repeat protein
MKNYEAAAVQFTNAINSGMTDGRFVDALFLRGKSYENLSLRDEKYRQRAIESYQTFVQSYVSDPRAREASVSLFFLRATSPMAAREALPGAPPERRDTMLLRLGQLLEGADSTSDALAAYETVAMDPRSPDLAVEAAFRTAMAFLRMGQADSASAWGARYLERAPEGAHAANVLAAMAASAMQRGDPASAVPFFRRLAGSFGYTRAGADAPLQLAGALTAAGSAEEAAGIYRDLAQQEQQNPLSEQGAGPDLLLALARAEQLSGHPADARSHLFEVLARGPAGLQAGQAYTLLGMIAKGEGEVDAATAYFHAAEKASPGVASTREVADLLFSAGNNADAIKQYTELAKGAQADSDRQYYASRIILAHLRSDNLAEADREIAAFTERFGKADEPRAAFALERGNYFYRKGDHASALKTFTDVAKHFDDTPSGPAARYWIGKTQQAAGKPQEATATLEELLRDHPEADIVSRAHLALGILYYDLEKWPESIKHYRVITDDPKADPSLLPFAISNLIEAYDVAGVNDAALALTRKYLELYPNAEDSFDKKIKIGILYDRLGYYDQAVMHLQGLLDQAGSDLEGEIRYYIAEANFNKGDYQQAILDFLKVPYLVTKKGKIDWTANSLYMSGQSYEKMGRFDQALTMYQQIVERPGIDENFRTAAHKEIDRVKLVLKKSPR